MKTNDGQKKYPVKASVRLSDGVDVEIEIFYRKPPSSAAVRAFQREMRKRYKNLTFEEFSNMLIKKIEE